MKKTMLIAVAVALAGVAAWTAYAYAQGMTPFGKESAVCPRAACAPTAQQCDHAAACHKDVAACHNDCNGCPEFKDEDKDGKCDVAGECRRADCTTCPEHLETRCAGHAEGSHVGHGKSGCGPNVDSGTGCRHSQH
jgi:hypothetical protein